MRKLETKYAELSTVKLAYSEYGNGENLLLLHGNSENKSIFGKYQTEYLKNFHTYAIDSRGHGKSISVDEKYTIKQYSEDIIEFCRYLNIDKAFVLGYSDGGNISLFLATQDPKRFSKIYAISPNYLACGTTDSSLSFLKKIYRMLNFMNRIGLNTKKAIMRFDLMLNDIGLSKQQLQSISTQVRIAYAQKDMIKHEHIIEISQLIPDASLKKIDGCTHISEFKSSELISDMQHFFAV